MPGTCHGGESESHASLSMTLPLHAATGVRCDAYQVKMLASLSFLLQGCTCVESLLEETYRHCQPIFLIEGRPGVNPTAKRPLFFPFPKEIYWGYTSISQSRASNQHIRFYFKSNPSSYIFNHFSLFSSWRETFFLR